MEGRFPEVGNDYYKGVSFVIVQNNIRYNLYKEDSTRVLENFRPNIALDSSTVLYLTEAYEDSLSKFLTDTLGWEELANRMQFLNSKIKVVPGHWFGWHFITHPEISQIEFREGLQKALVYFRIRYEGAEADFEKINNQWIMTNSRITWIE